MNGKLTTLERIMVQHAHPVKFVLEVIGIIWGTYFLWHQNVTNALLFGIGLPLVGTLAAWGHDEDKLAKSMLGKIMLVHADPVNLFFQVVGLLVMISGIYGHMTEMTLWGITIVVFGHIWGWGRVGREV